MVVIIRGICIGDIVMGACTVWVGVEITGMNWWVSGDSCWLVGVSERGGGGPGA